MTVDELEKVLEMQEEILQFSSFTNADAWELGNMIVMEAKRLGVSIAVRIRLNNGLAVFQHAMDGTTLYDEQWMERIENTVKVTEESSLRLYMKIRENQKNLEERFLEPREYAAFGGGFPIRIEEVGVIGSITVSGLDHVSNHDLLVKCISKYLHIAEVPRIRAM